MRSLQLLLERLLLRGVHYRLLFAALMIAALAILAGTFVFLFDPNFTAFTDAIWWAFLRLTDPGYLGDDEGVVGRSVSTLLTVAGFVVFVGLLIAILTQWMNQWVQRVEAGVSPLSLSDHILILGWNHRTPSIVLELLETRERVTRFLAGRKAKALRVVVLAEEVDASLRAELQTRLGSYWDDRRVLLRSGDPLQLASLERVSFRTAGAIILPGADFAVARPGVSDAEIIKSLASISQQVPDPARLPPAIAAIYNANRGVLAERAYGGRVEVVDADRLIARLLAQSVLLPGVWDVYDELLSMHRGNALFLRAAPQGTATTFGALQTGAGRALLLGVIDRSTGQVRLNPGAGAAVNGGDALVFMAEEYAHCTVKADAGSVVAPADLSLEAQGSEPCRIMVLGWSRKVPLLLRELLSYEGGVAEIELVGVTPVAERQALLPAESPVSIRQREANFLDPDVLATLRPQDYDRVIFLARERMGDEAVADAATYSAYLALDALLGSAQPHLVLEVLEEENGALFAGERDDVLLSPPIVSYILSQVALKPELGRVFRELLQPQGQSLGFLEITESGAALSFEEAAAAASERGFLALGVVAGAVDGGRLTLNPPRTLRWTTAPGDRLVVLGPAD